jgi:3-oxoacyl-[acyl-carrier protein] reductase
MKQQGWGRLLTITSFSVKQPLDNMVPSNSLRAAVAGLVKTLANEYGPHGALVNNLLPEYTATARLVSSAAKQAEAQGVKPEEFADVLVFLASKRASYVTGQSILVDGGFARGLL